MFSENILTASAKALIANTTVDNGGESTTDTGNNFSAADGTYALGGVTAPDYTCEDTQDKIFLLSINELTTSAYGFGAYDDVSEGNARIKLTTDYAKANSCSEGSSNGGDGGCWQSRSPAYLTGVIAYTVVEDGDMGGDMSECLNPGFGIVPALCISEK